MSPDAWTDARTRLEAAAIVDSGLIHWPNEPFEQPDPATDPRPWLEVEAVSDMAAPIELGPDGTWEERGALVVSVMVPANSGSMGARTLAKWVANTYRGLGPNATRYEGAEIGSGEPADAAGMYWRLPVLVRFVYQDRPTP